MAAAVPRYPTGSYRPQHGTAVPWQGHNDTMNLRDLVARCGARPTPTKIKPAG
ncbi:hypothetical protein [Prauserella sp. PE36]|uniref:hypothetical protein n=1 Tax=Prauserella sp. PE36 TaxID=1504709 RepID=UPI0013143A05|nr:hypothetical protein [Prauserella sp. PE36]